LFTLISWLDYSIDANLTKPFLIKVLGFYKWKMQGEIRQLPTQEENRFLQRKWLAQQRVLTAQRRYPYVKILMRA
jgi:hypothetical protein